MVRQGHKAGGWCGRVQRQGGLAASLQHVAARYVEQAVCPAALSRRPHSLPRPLPFGVYTQWMPSLEHSVQFHRSLSKNSWGRGGTVGWGWGEGGVGMG